MATALQFTTPSSLVLSRARYTEENLLKAIKQGVQQYVILGAGMDTFAFRHANMLDQLQVFEIDHPATQAFKRCRIAELGWQIPTQLHFIPMDFTKQDMAAELMHSSYDPQALSFVNWMGVTYYLPRDTVLTTLKAIADVAAKGSMVVFDYYDTAAFNPEKAARWVQAGLKQMQQYKEPIKSFFDSSTLASDLADVGLHLTENLSPINIEEHYFKGRTDHYHAFEHAYFAHAVVDKK